jgi:putative DNA primase/helicase
VLYEAQQRGFNIKDHAPAAPLSAEQITQLAKERAQRLADDQAEIERKQAAAASMAVKAWDSASKSGQSAYLQKKNVSAHGVRFARHRLGDTLLIPVMDASGQLCNIQRVFANGDKRFYTGGKVSSGFHLIGDAGAAKPLLIAEGYATGATLHEATGYPVAIAFSASNLKHIAALMQQRYPDKRLLLCADDDCETEQSTGKNTGVIAAKEAAAAIGGLWCKPLNLPAGGNDFNDLALSCGLAEVKNQIETVISEVAPASASPVNTIPINALVASHIRPQAHDLPSVKVSKGSVQKTPQNAANTSRQNRVSKSTGAGQSSKPFFTVSDEGVFYHAFHEGEPLPALKICSPLKVIARTRDSASSEWGYLLELSDPDGNIKRWPMSSRMLSGDGTQYRADLLSLGLMIEPSVKAKNLLTTYIQTANVPDRVRCVERTGWHDDVYVLPDRSIGQGSEQVLFQANGSTVSQFKQKGTLADWQHHISAYCRGNSRLLFFVSAAFASVLLHHAKVQSFGLHLMGSSSTGKSTAMKVAASVFGGADYAQSWHVTDNSLEATAQKHSDALLVLDELGQADPKMVGNIAYMLSNEKGKGRATQNATAKKIATWRLIFISDGELSLEAKMAEAGKATKGGQDVRMAHISADAGQGLGLFDTVHGLADGAALSRHMVNSAQQYHGTAGLAFIEWLVDNVQLLPDMLRQAIGNTAGKLCPANAHGQVKRVSEFFSLVAAGGELATAAGVTGWADGEVTEAAKTCFNDWLSSRGTAGDIEHDRMLALLPDFIQANGDSRFAWAHRALDDHAPKTINQAGYKRLISKEGNPIKSNADWSKAYGDKMHPDEAAGSSIEYLMYPSVFRDEVCNGYDARAVAAKLVALGVFEKDNQGKTSIVERIAGTKSRYYKISSDKLSSLQM